MTGCDECEREIRVGYFETGGQTLCRRCYNKLGESSGYGYVSPDRAERASEAIDLSEQHGRHRITTGGWGHGR